MKHMAVEHTKNWTPLTSTKARDCFHWFSFERWQWSRLLQL